MKTIEFWYEFASTYSYPAAMRISREAANHDVVVNWRPFLLGPIFHELGWSTSPFNLQPAKGRYMWRDLERICDHNKLPFTRPEVFPQNGLLAARVALAIEDQTQRADFSRRVFRAQFGEGGDIADRTLIEAILHDMELPTHEIIASTGDPAIKAQLRDQVSEAARVGIFGAPSFVTNDNELFWGNDRLDDALLWAAKR